MSTKKLLAKVFHPLKRLDSNLISIIKEKLTTLLVHNFSKDSVTDTGYYLVDEYEKFYVSKLNEFIKNEYNFSIKNVEDLSESRIKSITYLKNDLLIQLLVNYTQTFNNIRKLLNIKDIDDLNTLNKILEINSRPLENKSISKNDFIDNLTEAPNNISSYLSKHNLIFSWGKVKIDRFEDQDKRYLLFSMSKSEYCEFYDNTQDIKQYKIE